MNIFENISISVQNFDDFLFGQHFRKKFDFLSKFQKSGLRSTFSKKIQFRFKISKILILVNIFEKKLDLAQNFENFDFYEHFWKYFDFGSKFRWFPFRSTFSKKIRFPFKISKIWTSVNILEKIPISVQLLENLNFGHHFWKKFRFGPNIFFGNVDQNRNFQIFNRNRIFS